LFVYFSTVPRWLWSGLILLFSPTAGATTGQFLAGVGSYCNIATLRCSRSTSLPRASIVVVVRGLNSPQRLLCLAS